MKKCLIVALLCFCAVSHAMRWIDGNTPSKEAVKAFKILGVTLPTDIVEAKDFCQKHYFKSWQEISKGNDVVDIEGNKISPENLEKFLNYVDKKTVRSSLEYTSISDTTIAVLPSASIDTKTNIYLFALLKKYIALVSEVVIFTANEVSKTLVTDLFKETFKDFNVNNLKCLVAKDEKNVAQSCAKELSSMWKESNITSPYCIVSHWGPFNDSVKDILPKKYYIGSELQPVPWKEALKMYGNGKNGCASVKLREAAVAFFNATQEKKN